MSTIAYADLRTTDEARRTRIVSRVAVGLSSVSLVYLAVALPLLRVSRPLIVLELLSSLFFLGLAWAAATNRSRYAPALLIAATLIHAVVAALQAGGIMGQGPIILFVVCALAGLVLRPIANLVSGSLTIGAVVLLALFSAQGWITASSGTATTPATTGGIIARSAVYILLLAVVTAAAYINAWSHEQALARQTEQSRAVAEQNTRLVEQGALLQQQATELAQHRDRLEQEVAERTAELEHALEAARRNAIALHELQSPVVPVADDVLIVPLIGAFDSARAERFVGELLAAIQARRAHTIVLDVTGMPRVDTLAAQTLLQAANAAKLLGAALVLVGVTPAVAQTIVGLGVDLHTLRIERDLQSALATRRQGAFA